MSRRSSNMKVGIFVTAGIALTLVVLTWLGTANYLSSAGTYVTFFNESVQGLQVDSRVKYRGVDVGRVTAIRVAPDYRLIEVVMQVDFDPDRLARNMTAQIRSIGITGIAFIELDQKKFGQPDQAPVITFAAEYPIIPSKPSEMQQVYTVLHQVMDQLRLVDFKGIAMSLESTIKSLGSLVNDPRLKSTVMKVESAVGNLEAISARFKHSLEDGEINGILQKTAGALKSVNDTLASAKGLLEDTRREVKSLALEERSREIKELLDSADRRLGRLSGRAEDVLGSVGQAADKVDALAEKLTADPAELLWGSPPPSRQLPPEAK